jgi:hypothetical protein
MTTRRDNYIYRPSVEEIRCWGDSFDRLMKSSMGRVVFREFLKCEYSEENILFWLACEDLKKDNNPDVVEEKARLIYEDYISILSPKEVCTHYYYPQHDSMHHPLTRHTYVHSRFCRRL